MTAYRDIKDIVIGTTHNLDMVPVEVLRDLCNGDAHPIYNEYLTNMEHSNIKCVTHAYMPSWHEYNYEDGMGGWCIWEALHYVCTILVYDTPALFFVHARSDHWWEPYTYTYILDICACSILLSVLTDRAGWVCGKPISEDKKIEELSEVGGIKIEYGST